MPDPAIDPTTALAPPPAWTPPTASPSPMDTTPASQDPEVAAGHAHQSWLGHILDVVGSILGGDQTIHVTKAPDGTMTVTHDPSTSGEKWARVAQAAMLGGAQGLAHGQGPGGMANAIAAGTMTGAALPQQQLTAANAEATAANKQMMTKAQHALLDQQIATQQLQNKELPLEYQRQKQTFALEQIGRLRDMGALHVANTKNPQEMAQFGNSDPLSMAAHTGASDDVMQPVAMPDGSVDWWRIPADRAKQLTTDRATWDEMVHDPKDYGNIITKTHVVDPGTETYGARALREKGAAATNEKVQTDAANYRVNQQKATNEGIPKTGAEAIVRSNLPGTPAPLAAAYARSAQQIGQQEINKAVAGRQATAGTPEQYQALAADLNAGNVDISQIRTRKDWPQMYAAARQYAIDNGLPAFDPATASAKYKARVQTIGKYTGAGDAATKIQGFSTLLEHLGDMSDNADELRRTNSPYLNRPINSLDRDIAGGTQVGPAELRTSAPAHEFANVLSNNRALNNQEKEEAAKTLNVNMTPAQLQGNGKQMARTAIERLAPVFQAYREATNGQESPTQLTPRAITTLRNMGLYDFAMQEMHGQAPATAPPTGNTDQAARQPTPQVPPGAVIGRDKTTGKPVGYQLNGKWVSF